MLSGVEAIVELLILRRQLDERAGLSTATMVSGYPGSPLGTLDLALENQAERLAAHRVIHRPGVNEELALAAVWGSQMGRAVPYKEVDGVAGAWYGKTPGLDRSGDVLRHANAMGSGPHGGLVLFCGDDPTAKSSTLACDSQYTFEDACVPILFPGDQQEIIDLGVHAYRLSRFSGALVGMRIVTTVADGNSTVDLDPERHPPSVLPTTLLNGQSWKHEPLATIGPHQIPNQELLVVHHRLEAAKAYVSANGLDRVLGAGPGASLGIVCAGKTYRDLLQALTDLGVSLDQLSALGIRILKLAMTYPLVEPTVIEFARSVDELLVIEEKRPFIETRLRAILHEAGVRTRVLGKRDRTGSSLVSPVGELNAGDVAAVLARVVPMLAYTHTHERPRGLSILQIPSRPPAYCSGCPHNRSTVVPVGTLAGGGVGCHGIMYFEARQRDVHKLPPPPMGAEGAPWIGLAPFVAERHVVQNLGDGTLSHSGILAIRACVDAGVNITFKILYNAAVAMTGGQRVAGLLDVPALTRELDAEGVRKIVVCSSEPQRYGKDARWAPNVEVLNRDRLPEVQERLAAETGVTVLIFDQRCAAEARRLRKRGELATPPARVVINEAVCEGCGDCMVRSNCASVQPIDTEFGQKKRIDDLTCNRDYTCIEGECPSFVSIAPKPGRSAPRIQRSTDRLVLPSGNLPLPTLARIDGQFGVYFTGIGGTGVVTTSRILATAAERAGYFVMGMDQTGLAQKGGAVVSHLRFAADRDAAGAASIGREGADLYLSGDIFQAAGGVHLERIKPGRTIAVIESDITPTAAMLQTAVPASDWSVLRTAISERVGEGRVAFVDARQIADRAFADSVLANVVLMGAAFQLGGLPISLEAIESAFRQTRSPTKNRAAFEWGRWAVHDPVAVRTALTAAQRQTQAAAASQLEPSSNALTVAATLLHQRALPAALSERLLRRTAQVIDYQSASLGQRYLNLLERVARYDSAERNWALMRAVAEGWFRLLTYKDEYEVARLHASTDYDAIARNLGIEGDYTLKYHLHPELLRKLGRTRKLAVGKPAAMLFRVLQHMKHLRGTAFDVFGWGTDRRLERAVAREYEQMIVESLGTQPYDILVELAASAALVKGYGTVKARNAAMWRKQVNELRRSNARATA